MAIVATFLIPLRSCQKDSPGVIGTILSILASWILIAAVTTIYYFYIYPHISPLRHIPTAPQPPVHKRFMQDIQGHQVIDWMNNVPNDGLIRAFGLLNSECLIATSPEALKDMFVAKQYDWIKPRKRAQVLASIIGNGLVTIEGEKHKRQRKLLQPSFNFRHIQELYSLFWNTSKELVQCIRKTVSESGSDRVIDIQSWFARATLDIIGSAGFGLHFNSLKYPHSDLVSRYRIMFESRAVPVVNVLAKLVPTRVLLSLPSKRLQEISTSKTAISTHMQKVIRQRKEQLAESDQKLAEKDILSIAMQAEAYTEQELTDHSMTFLAAGQDTTSFALTCTLLELSRNQELQSRLRREIRANIPSPDSEDSMINSNDIDRVPWLTAVCNETLRFYPSVDQTGRVTLKSDTVLVGEKVPKDTIVETSIVAINRYQPWWSGTPYDASEWHPERWFEDLETGKLSASGGATDAWSFMTFIRGNRSCIGEKFARSEMAVILAALIGKFEFRFEGASGKGKPIEELEIHYAFTGHVSGGIWVTATEVEGW